MSFQTTPDPSKDFQETSSEETPLLPSESSRPALNRGSSSVLHLPHIPQVHNPQVIVFFITLMVFCIMIGSFLTIAPSIRIYEDIICHHYYDQLEGDGHIDLLSDIDEKECKVDAIQEELAIVLGGLELTMSIPGIIFAFPYGLLADRIGRKKVFGLGITGLLFMQSFIILVTWFWHIFPLRMIWLGPILLSIGGGNVVLQNMIYSMISDASTDATRANNFFIAGSGTLIAEMIAPGVASWLMLRSPWIPFLSGTAIIAVASSCVFFIPENLKPRVSPSPSSASVPSMPQDHEDQVPTSLAGKLRLWFRKQYASFMAATSILHSPAILLLLLSFIAHPLVRQSIDVALRYISKRYGWTLAQAGLVLVLRAAVNILLLLAILPVFSYFLTSTFNPDASNSRLSRILKPFRFGLSTREKDLILARISLLITVGGFALLAFSPTVSVAILSMAVFTLGTGFSALARSLITTLVDQQHVARLYAAISVVETFGSFAGGPLLAGLFTWGLRMAGREGGSKAWLGVPFWGISLLFMLTGGGVFFVRFDEEAKSDGVHVGLEEEMLLDPPERPVVTSI